MSEGTSLVGKTIAERYEVVRVLGEGGMGAVYEAVNTLTGRSVALKVPRAELMNDDAFRRRFMREARAAAALSHPNVIEILDVALHGADKPVLVMELLQGAPLSEVIVSEGKLSVRETASYLVPVFDALRLAHERGVVHRDFKPENVFLADQPGGEVIPKLLDFGIAKVTSGSDLADASGTTTGTMLGTPYYMAPEQVSGDRDVDARADVWAAGAVVYECLSGRRPFRGDNFGQIFVAIIQTSPTRLPYIVADLPGDVIAAVHAALTRDRSLRPPDLGFLIDALAPHVAPDVRRTKTIAVRPGRGGGTPTPAKRVPEDAPTVVESDGGDVRSGPRDPGAESTLAAPRDSLPDAVAQSPLARSTAEAQPPIGTLGGAETVADGADRPRSRSPVAMVATLGAAVLALGVWRLVAGGEGVAPVAPGASVVEARSADPVVDSTPPPPSVPAASVPPPDVPASAAASSAGSAAPSAARPARTSASASTAAPRATAVPSAAQPAAPPTAAPTSPGGLLRDPRY